MSSDPDSNFPSSTSGGDRNRDANGVHILSVRLDAFDFDGVMGKIGEFLNEERTHQIATVNPEFVMAAQRDPEFLRILNSTELNVADGIGLQLAAKITGVEIGKRVTGVDLTWALAGYAARNGFSVFLLGAAEGVARMAADKLAVTYPGLKIAGAYSGSPGEPGLVERINDSRADILFVAFGSPKQENFIYSNKEKLRAKIAMGVGGTFDYIAEVVPRAPGWMRKLGMEWLYRLAKQPERAGRIFTAVVRFPLRVIISALLNPSPKHGKSSQVDDGRGR